LAQQAEVLKKPLQAEDFGHNRLRNKTAPLAKTFVYLAFTKIGQIYENQISRCKENIFKPAKYQNISCDLQANML
jgi:hypothetical protein